MSGPERVTVEGDQPYDVVVGRDLLGDLAPAVSGATQALLVHAPSLADAAASVERALRDAGVVVTTVSVPDGEEGKDVAVAADLWGVLGQQAFTRTDVVVSLGGGAVTDLAGWVAASWLRGVRVVHLPSTLLAMVDAAVGGKTGVNTAEGKNLVGAFHVPAAVLCDLSLLDTLPPADLASGMAEVAKTGFIGDRRILDLVETDPAAAVDATGDVLPELVTRSVRFKAGVVGADLRERGGREVLNYGHTLGHAIERTEGFRWRHGDAVSVGLVYAAGLSYAVGRIDATLVARHVEVLRALGLPTTYAGSWAPLRDAMRVDKKARGSTLRFVLLDDVERPVVVPAPGDDVLEKVFMDQVFSEVAE